MARFIYLSKRIDLGVQFWHLLAREPERSKRFILRLFSLERAGQNCQGAFHTVVPRVAHCEQGADACF
jgi:hypothetical protein